MIPIASNTADQGCSPVSSNCVVWQGPNLSCINLCKGDTVSDVVYKLATEVCALQGGVGISDLDLSQLVQVCSTTPEPQKTLAAVLDLLIDKVVCLSDIVDAIGPSTSFTEPTLTLPACLQYTNAQGQTVTQLIHNQYSQTLANKICQINTLVNSHTTQINGLDSRVTVLENETATVLPQLAVQCLTNSATPVNLEVAVDTIATELCNLKGVVGTNTAISTAAAKQCTQLSTLPALSATGTMSAIPGWKSSVTTLSDSIFNLWLTVCDMRGAISSLKDCCGSVDCSAVIVDFIVTPNTGRTQLTLNFNGLTTIPTGYSECTQLGSKLTITDTAGHVYITNIQVVANKNNNAGVAVSLSGTTLDATLNYTIKLEPCVSKDGKSCVKEIIKTDYAPCTTITINGANIS